MFLVINLIQKFFKNYLTILITYFDSVTSSWVRSSPFGEFESFKYIKN